MTDRERWWWRMNEGDKGDAEPSAANIWIAHLSGRAKYDPIYKASAEFRLQMFLLNHQSDKLLKGNHEDNRTERESGEVNSNRGDN